MRSTLVLVLVAACGHPHPGSGADAATGGGDGGGGDAAGSGAIDAPGTPVDAAPMIDAPFVPGDPFTVDTACPAATFQQLVAYFPPGGTSAGAGTFALRTRSRTSCNDVTGCSPWIDPSPVQLQQIFERDGYPQGTPHPLPVSGSVGLTLDTSGTPAIHLALEGTEPGMPQHAIQWRCDPIAQNASADHFDCSVQITFPGDYPSLLWFVDTYAGGPLFDNTTLVEWNARICADGRYQLVSKLASQLGTSTSGANNRNQIAIYGQL